MSDTLDLATVEASYFEPLLHEKFSTQLWDENGNPVPLDFELVSVVPSKMPGQPGRRTPFSLFFDGSAGLELDQSTYVLSHPVAGEMALFLVPVELQGDHLQFEAVLN